MEGNGGWTFGETHTALVGGVVDFWRFKAQKERITGHYPNDRSHTWTRQEAALCSISSAFAVTELLMTYKGGWEECAALLDNMCTKLLIILKKLLTAFYTWRHILPALIRLSRWNCFMQQKLGGLSLSLHVCPPLFSCPASAVRCSFIHLSSAPRHSYFSQPGTRNGTLPKTIVPHIHLVKSPQMKCLEKRGPFKQKKREGGKEKPGRGCNFIQLVEPASKLTA